MQDRIILDGIEVMACVGVPDEERARPQRLEISIVLHLDLSQAGHNDDLGMSINYETVCNKTRAVVEQRPRRLIETVAEDVAQALLDAFRVENIEVEVRKFVLPRTRSVAVRIIREAQHS